MSHPAQRAEARSRVFQLLAMAFSHPQPSLHAQMSDGRFHHALDAALECAYGVVSQLPRAGADLAAFEAQYIELFAVGHKGRPAVPLCAGEYLDLLDGQPRPSFMQRYARFYRHFGVRTRETGEGNELPDHLTCQLEFMAWLGHLEAQALADSADAGGYQRAQRDFLVNLMVAFCQATAQRLARQCERRGSDPWFPALGALSSDFVGRNRIELESVHGTPQASSAPCEPKAVTEEQDLWG